MKLMRNVIKDFVSSPGCPAEIMYYSGRKCKQRSDISKKTKRSYIPVQGGMCLAPGVMHT